MKSKRSLKIDLLPPGRALLGCVAGLLIGCSSVRTETNKIKSMVVEPAPDAGFIEHPEAQFKRADLPFQKVWVKPGFDASFYKELVVAPVNTQYMLEMDWLHQLSTANWLRDVNKDFDHVRWAMQQLMVFPEAKRALRKKRVTLAGAVYELNTGGAIPRFSLTKIELKCCLTVGNHALLVG